MQSSPHQSPSLGLFINLYLACQFVPAVFVLQERCSSGILLLYLVSRYAGSTYLSELKKAEKRNSHKVIIFSDKGIG